MLKICLLRLHVSLKCLYHINIIRIYPKAASTWFPSYKTTLATCTKTPKWISNCPCKNYMLEAIDANVPPQGLEPDITDYKTQNNTTCTFKMLSDVRR